VTAPSCIAASTRERQQRQRPPPSQATRQAKGAVDGERKRRAAATVLHVGRRRRRASGELPLQPPSPLWALSAAARVRDREGDGAKRGKGKRGEGRRCGGGARRRRRGADRGGLGLPAPTIEHTERVSSLGKMGWPRVSGAHAGRPWAVSDWACRASGGQKTPHSAQRARKAGRGPPKTTGQNRFYRLLVLIDFCSVFWANIK
jgi:hypothetical protein